MEKRSYNIFFDLHTVSGIVISVLVYVIFFAGSFAFFRNEIINWERGDVVNVRTSIDLDLDQALDTLHKEYNLYGRDITITRPNDERRVSVYLTPSKDTLLNKQGREGDFLYLDSETFKTYSYENSYTLGEFLYRLHFFAQVPYPTGYFLSGFTALFLFFAVLTGVLVHWKKIVTNFYLFRPREKLKTVWTDAHTVLGTIGLPFQAIYAVTGAFFMINILLLIPNALVLYNGDDAKVYDDLGYNHQQFEFKHKPLAAPVHINAFMDRAHHEWNDYHVAEIIVHNYGDEGMHVLAEGHLANNVQLTSQGELILNVASNQIVHRRDPHEGASYVEKVKHLLYSLHYGDYAGTGLRYVSFWLGLLSCFVVITGILVWLEARNKKSIPEKQKKFNRMVGHIFLSICLAMYPVTALSFIVTKLVPSEFDAERQTLLYSVYFIVWLVLAVVCSGWRNNARTNSVTLWSGAVLGLFVPVVNGVVTGNWFWLCVFDGRIDFFVVDFLWITLSLFSFLALWQIKKKRTKAVVEMVEVSVG
ncbi:PepSY-associated TM helix domain-containing protein [Chryseolinea lacunae]|uniref:PepSY domain-containing protein n=1 Tax=Chryseolinea lacunae TaxID=2801331 RepID=A0ABS1KT13_9BACT|nr:PepSY-associated TM helix domain-containing protein [Chryseolinea lacunae]MBL0741426.1 PepSY domain-containing protein [Chryseolinea lacunae]